MNVIDRYVIEVGKRLPLVKGRKDIEKEIRSTLEDMLEDRAQKAGHPADEAMEIELLKEYGAPDKVAATYDPHPYLIGPRMFPFFTKIMKIVLFALTIAFVVTTGIQVATHPPTTGIELLDMIVKGLLGIVSGAISGFGNFALIFAILERFAPALKFVMDEDKKWDPTSLLKEQEADDVKPWEPIAEIVFTFIAISIFNFNPQLIGIYTFVGEKWMVIPVLSDAFFRWMPLINLSWIAGIILDGMLLRSGRWTLPTRLFALATKILKIVIGFLLLTGSSIITVTTETLKSIEGFDAEAARILGIMAQQGVRGFIALVMFLIAIDIIKSAYKLITQKVSA